MTFIIIFHDLWLLLFTVFAWWTQSQQSSKQPSSPAVPGEQARVWEACISHCWAELEGQLTDELCGYSLTEWIVKHLVPPTCPVLFLSITRSIQYRAQMHFNLLPHPTLAIVSSFGGLVLSYWPSGLAVQHVTKYVGLLPWEPGVNNVLFKGPFFKKKKKSGVKFHGLTWYRPEVVAFWLCLVWNWPVTRLGRIVCCYMPRCVILYSMMCCKPASHVPYCKNTLCRSCALSVQAA